VKIGRPAVPELIRALEYAEDRARVEAVEALGTIRDPRAAEPLAGLLTVPSREIWGATRVALWRIGAAAVPALLEVLGSADPTARWRSVHVLGEIRDSAAVEPLVALLKKDRDTGVRMEIAAVLGRIRDRTSCDVLLDALHDW
jgi:HEAT repeat protein